MESPAPTSPARNKQPFKSPTDKTPASSSSSSDTRPLTPEEAIYVNFGVRLPAEKKKEEKPAETTNTTDTSINQLNPDGSNRKVFNNAAFAYNEPKAKETPEDKKGAEVTRENPEEKIEDINLDIAVGQLTEQERKEIIRQRQREAEDMAQEAAITRNFLQRAWGSVRFSFSKNFEKFKFMQNAQTLSDSEVFANNITDFRARSDQRAEELSTLMADNLFSQHSKTKGFQEVYPDIPTSPEYQENQKELVSLIKKFTKDKKLSREDFETEKNKILKEMTKNMPDQEGALNSSFDNIWVKVEALRTRVESLNNASDVVDKMNINLNIRFGKARLNHETTDTETLSTKIEEKLLNSKWINMIPFEKRYWVAGGLIAAANLGSSSLRSASRGIPFAGAFVSGTVSGGFEYLRKRDEMTETNSRLTRMIAEGRSPSEMLKKYNSNEIASNINVVKIEEIKTNIENLNGVYEKSSNPQDLEKLLNEIARFQSLYESGKAKNKDLLGSTSLEELQKQRLAVIGISTEILQKLNSTNPDIKNKYNEALQKQNEVLEKQMADRETQFKALRNTTSLNRAGEVALATAVGSLVFAEAKAMFSNNTTGLVEYLRGENTNEGAQTSLAWAARWLKGDQTSQFEKIVEKFSTTETISKIDTISSFASSEEVEKALSGKSDLISDLTRTYTGQAEDQIQKYGGLTRSLWNKDSSGVLDIFGRNVVDGKSILHDFDKSYLEAFNDGKFRAIVNLSDGRHVDVSSLINLNNGVVQIDFSKEPGIVGEIFKNGHVEGLEHIKNIQYGIGSGDKIDIVSTISGGGQEFSPEPTNLIEDVNTTETITKDLIKQTFKLNPQEIDDFYLFYFPSPKTQRIEQQRPNSSENSSNRNDRQSNETIRPEAISQSQDAENTEIKESEEEELQEIVQLTAKLNIINSDGLDQQIPTLLEVLKSLGINIDEDELKNYLPRVSPSFYRELKEILTDTLPNKRISFKDKKSAVADMFNKYIINFRSRRS